MAAKDLFASVLRIEWNALDRTFAIRCAIGVVAGVLLGYSTHQPLFSVACGMGAISTGFASLQGIYYTRVFTMIAMAVAMALSTIVGISAATSIPVELAALAVWGAAYGLFSSLGAAASAVGVNATIALIIFSNFPLSPVQAIECGAFVIAGGMIQTVLLIFSWPIQRYPEERSAIADVYSSLASYAHAIDCANPTLPPARTLTAARETLEDPRPFGRRIAFAAFQTLFDEADRIRSTLGGIAATNCPAYLPVRGTVVGALRTIESALKSGKPPGDVETRTELHAESSDQQVRALFGQLRAAWRNVSIPLEARSMGTLAAPNLDWLDLNESLAILRSNLTFDSPFGRHAVRLAITLACTGVLAHVLPFQRGYWMTLTAALVLRPDFTTTLARGIARILGTLLGVAVATACVLALPDTPGITLTLACFFAAIGYVAFQLNYGLYTVTVTAYVVFALALVGTPENAAVLSRTIATLLGGGIAMLTYALWPTWEAPQTRERIIDLIDHDRLYARTLLSGLMNPALRNTTELRKQRTVLWTTRATAEQSVERMLAEPRRSGEIPRNVALGIMAATQRMGLANLALATMYDSASTPSLPELAPFATALETVFAGIEALLRGQGVVPAGTTTLRDTYVRLADTVQWDRRDALLSTLDIMIDAVNTASELARRA